jgi:pSer/pThr/pTyr-binding forkhead associated (FHA) protein
MEVKLVVTNGRHAGREIPIKGPKFFIGRAEDCHLRPGSDLVSRHHCVILVAENSVKVRDFGSKNGTFVNGKQVSPESPLMPGDRLVVGQLDFDVRITGMPEQPKPATSVSIAAADTSVDGKADAKPPSGGKKSKPAGKDTVKVDDDLDISRWFGDEEASAKTETQTIDMSTVAHQAPGEATVMSQPPKDPEPQEGGNGPKRDVSEAEKEKARRAHGGQTTQDAAAEMLKKFFNARR